MPLPLIAPALRGYPFPPMVSPRCASLRYSTAQFVAVIFRRFQVRKTRVGQSQYAERIFQIGHQHVKWTRHRGNRLPSETRPRPADCRADASLRPSRRLPHCRQRCAEVFHACILISSESEVSTYWPFPFDRVQGGQNNGLCQQHTTRKIGDGKGQALGTARAQKTRRAQLSACAIDSCPPCFFHVCTRWNHTRNPRHKSDAGNAPRASRSPDLTFSITLSERKLCISTSAFSNSHCTTAKPALFFKSTTKLSLLKLRLAKGML